MPTAQDLLNQLCERCRTDYAPAFSASPRLSEVIAGDLVWPQCCFVRDEVRFINNGRLIFAPQPGDGRKRYCQAYYLVCRKLVISGGQSPGTHNPCGSDDPGQEYAGNNVITWQDRLQAAHSGTDPNPASADDGTPFDVNVWSSANNPNGDNGADGGNGTPGAKGDDGTKGIDAPGSLTIVALEIEFANPLSHLTIDWDGQTGGDGGTGQNGGNGGNGMGGRDGESDTSWPGTGCDRAPGHGGRGGNGGDGGRGGAGGAGGNAGPIYVITPHSNWTGSGGFVNGQITFVNDGGSGGTGGKGGRGGQGGHGGKPGFKSSLCDAANSGADGSDGYPPATLTGSANVGATGAHGMGSSVKFYDIIDHPCTHDIPLPVVVNSITPDHFCRGFSSPANADVTVLGNNFSQVTAVQPSLAGVSATIKPSSSDTELDLKLSASSSSALGSCDLAFQRVFGAEATQAGALTVGRFEVQSISPATGARNSNVSVTITGACFDAAASVQNVNVGGTGVDALNVVVVNETTVTCVLQIANLAPTGARNITVSTGGLSHTLLNAFTVS